jgi:hypothetical protein
LKRKVKLPLTAGMFKKLCRLFGERSTNVSDEERSGYPLYSIELAPSDYHLVLHRKAFLAAQSLRGDQDTKGVVQERLGGELLRRRHTKAGPTIC